MTKHALDAGSRRLRILAIHRYFWPDTPPYASMLRAIASRWVEDGHEVDVLSTQPSYKPEARIPRQAAAEKMDGFRVRRLTLLPEAGKPVFRLLNVVLFSLAIVMYTLLRRRYDVIMISTSPPIVSGLVARWAAKLTGARFVYHCMDIYPEIGKISGDFRHPALFSLLQRIDSATCREATRVVVLSRDMENAIRSRKGAESARIAVINNFSIPNFDTRLAEVPLIFVKRVGVFRVMFAGNVGRFQGLECFVDAMAKLSGRDDIEFVFMGGGRALDELRSRAQDLHAQTVRFFPHQPLDIAKAIIAEADLCVVSLLPDVVRYAFPSKTMAYLEEGRPLLVSVELDSELARAVESEEIGVAVRPGDVEGISGVILKLADNPDQWQRLQTNAALRGSVLFSETTTLDRWSALIRGVESEVE
ncbi:MAG: glycosyltransferase family 4 protein [Gallionella sp.]|nr:glycosyltransferase family 4 protein [Gallionella sp.]